jgi:hypothetical protein
MEIQSALVWRVLYLDKVKVLKEAHQTQSGANGGLKA